MTDQIGFLREIGVRVLATEGVLFNIFFNLEITPYLVGKPSVCRENEKQGIGRINIT